jgi:hypothetical protein
MAENNDLASRAKAEIEGLIKELRELLESDDAAAINANSWLGPPLPAASPTSTTHSPPITLARLPPRVVGSSSNEAISSAAPC